MNLSDFFKKAGVSNVPKAQQRQTKSVEEFLPYLEEAREESKGDPVEFMKRVADRRETKLVSYKLPSTFLSATRSPSTGQIRSSVVNKTKPVNMFGNQYIIQSVIEPSPEVYDGVSSLSEIPFGPGEAYFTYMINDDGLHLARYRNSFEIGTGHENLGLGGDRITGDGVDVLIAGEVRIAGNAVEFNFQSGTFSKDLGLDSHPLYKKFLIEYVGELFNRDGAFSSVTYTDDVLFPPVFPSLEKIRRDCDHSHRIQVKYKDSDEVEDFCQNARFGDLSGAIYYFSRNPWEHVYLSEGGDLYHNPDPLHPARFVIASPPQPARRERSTRKAAQASPYTRSQRSKSGHKRRDRVSGRKRRSSDRVSGRKRRSKKRITTIARR